MNTINEAPDTLDDVPLSRSDSLYEKLGYGDNREAGEKFVRRLRRSDPTFPKPYKLGKFYFWRDDEILEWLATKRVA